MSEVRNAEVKVVPDVEATSSAPMQLRESDQLAQQQNPNWGEIAKVVRRTYAKDLNDAEFAAFLMVAKKLGLDPVSREIIPTIRVDKYGNRTMTIIITRDGYLRAAMRDPHYRGLQSMVVRQGDKFQVNPAKGEVLHEFGAERKKILGAWAVAYHAHRPPVVVFVDFDEYFQANQKNPVWRSYPSAMIQKVAEVAALRRQFNLTGIVAAEEIPEGASVLVQDEVEIVEPVVTVVDQGRKASTNNGDAKKREAYYKTITSGFNKLGITDKAKRAELIKKFVGRDISASEATLEELEKIVKGLADLAAQRDAKDSDYPSITETKAFKAMMAYLNYFGIRDRETRLAVISRIVGRKIESSKNLSLEEVEAVNDVFKSLKADAEVIDPEERSGWLLEVALAEDA